MHASSSRGLALSRPLPAPCRIRVEEVEGHMRVVTAEPVAAGEVILRFQGFKARRPDRHSLQIGKRTHLVAPAELDPRAAVGEYGWRYLNHACAPSASLRGLDLVALTDLPPGAEVTFDYNTTEWDMASPFECRCGAPSCAGTIRGYRHLDGEARARLLPFLADHLRLRT